MSKVNKYKKINLPIWPILHSEAIFSLIDVYIRKNWSWWGKYEIKFIKKFLKIHPAKYAIMTTSGTNALEIVLSAIDLKKDDEVIVPAYTWISTATAVVKAGAKPVFVDIDPDTLCISPDRIKDAITEKTKAIIPVHLFSAMADMNKINEIAKEYNLKIIEDCAQAHAMMWNNKAAGTFSDAAIFSFQQSKLLTSGEGGIIITNSKEIAEKADRISHIGCSIYTKENKNKENLVPSKYLVSEFQSAVLENQCNYLLKETKKREENAKYLDELLKGAEGLRVQSTLPNTTRRSYYYYAIIVDSERIKEGYTINNIIEEINQYGLCAQNIYSNPVYEYPLWTIDKSLYIKKDCPIAEKISKKEIIALPHTFLLLNKKTIKTASELILNVVKKYIV